MAVAVALLVVAAFATWMRLREVESRVRWLEGELLSLRAREKAAGAGAPVARPVAAPAPAEAPPAARPAPAATPAPTLAPSPSPAPAPAPAVPRMPVPGPTPSPPAGVAGQPAWSASEPPVIRWVRDYFTTGNLVVRVGIIVLFFGVAFLLKYAAEHTHVPIEARLAGVALGGLALFAVGWRLRTRRAGFALALQGGAVGVLYLVAFAAFRLYHLLPPGLAFALLAVLGAASLLLAALQDAMSLAVLGMAGGFLAPVLASTGQGSHVALFSYYALLDLGVVALAWRKAWRPLNLMAFVFTYGIGTAWGVLKYQPAQFASTEPFLLFFFLAFLAVSVLFAWRRAVQLTHYVDGTLVFGNPAIAFGLQMALVGDGRYARALSALAGAALYVALAWWLHRARREGLRLLVESFLALGIVLGTIAVPLALDGHWTASTWALEGAAVLWMGLRQGRRLPTVAGVLLQVLAGCAYLQALGLPEAPGAMAWPVINAACIGALFIAAAGMASSAVARRPWPLLADAGVGQALSHLLLAWSLAWWLYAGARELREFVPGDAIAGSLLALLAATSLACAWAGRRWRWPAMAVPALALLPAMWLAWLTWGWLDTHPLGDWGWLGWPLGFVALGRALRWHEQVVPRRIASAAHGFATWLLALVAGWELHWQVARAVPEGSAWAEASWGLAPVLLLVGLGLRGAASRWPVATQRDTYRGWCALGLAALAGAWTLWLNVANDGAAAPLPYLPLLNPVDIAIGAALLVMLRWLLLVGREPPVPAPSVRKALRVAWIALLFTWLNAVLLRSLHHWAGIPYEADALWSATVVQAAVSIFWTVLALATTLWATRAGNRPAWFGGAALMGVVVVKLFVIDLARIGTVPRIVSFIAVGVLMLVIGYYSPLPPAREQEAS